MLQGLFEYLYRGERLMTAVFEVRDDSFGVVGVGRVTAERIPDVEGEGERG